MGAIFDFFVNLRVCVCVCACARAYRRKSERRRLLAADRLLVTSLLPDSRDESRGSRASVLYAPSVGAVQAGHEVTKRRASHYQLAPDYADFQQQTMLCQCCRQRVAQVSTKCQ